MPPRFTSHSLLLLAFYSIALFFSCGAKQSAAAYHNQLMTLTVSSDAHMGEMNRAMKTHDYNQAEAIRETWSTDLDQGLLQAKKADGYKGDDQLKTAVIGGLGKYQNTVNYLYKELIELRSNPGRTDAKTTAPGGRQTTEEALLDSINTTFERAASDINQASNYFQSRYSGQ